MSYSTLAPEAVVTATVTALTERGFLPETVATGADALARIKALIPAGASVMNGSSTTLNQIGFVDYLKSGTHGWDNVHEAIVAEQDPAKKAVLRKQGVLADYYLGSVHAVSETGELVIASGSGSQLPHLVFTSQNIILVVSEKKITKDLASGLDRLETHVFPLEDARMKSVNMGGASLNKLFIWKREPAYLGRKVYIILVKEDLGF